MAGSSTDKFRVDGGKCFGRGWNLDFPRRLIATRSAREDYFRLKLKEDTTEPWTYNIKAISS